MDLLYSLCSTYDGNTFEYTKRSITPLHIDELYHVDVKF